MGDARDLDGAVRLCRRGGTQLIGEFRQGCGGDLYRPGRSQYTDEQVDAISRFLRDSRELYERQIKRAREWPAER
jgi:hypothetical protein